MHPFDIIGLLYTRTCPLACGHCIIESSPKATGKIAFASALAMLPTIARHTGTICFTGGEPLLYYSEIVRLVEAAKRLGLITSVVSGAGWVRKRDIAERRIARLKQAGLDKLCVSADRYHEAFSPPDRAHMLADIARREGITVIVRGVIGADRNACEEKERFAPAGVTYHPVPLVRLGAARNLPEEHFHHAQVPYGGRCSVALSPVIEPDGNVYACCGPSRYARKPSPLVLGNIHHESLETILLRGAEDPILKALTLIGPSGLLRLLRQTPGMEQLVPLRHQYTGMCELCLDMTDSPAIVAAIRARLCDGDAQVLLAAAKLWVQQSAKRGVPPQPDPRTQAGAAPIPTHEASNDTQQHHVPTV